MKRKTEPGIFEMLADKSQKPNALGFQPFDPKLVEAIMRQIRR